MDECVEMVKEMTAELFHEHRELVERLNRMQKEIEEEHDAVTKVRRKVEWAAERDRAVELMNKVHPCPLCTPHASECNSLPPLLWARAMTTDPARLLADHRVTSRRARRRRQWEDGGNGALLSIHDKA